VKVEDLRDLVGKAARVYLLMSRDDVVYNVAYEVWHCLERELTEAESKEGS